MANYTDPKTGKVISSGKYIPDDHPDVVKQKNRRDKAQKTLNKISDFIPFKTKKFKKAIKEEKEKFESRTDKQKINSAKNYVDSFLNAKAKKMTKTEGSFAKGGRAGYSVGGKAFRGVSKILLKK